MAKFLESHGIAQKKFSDAYNSFSVETKMQRSKILLAAYKIEQVPEMAVDGRYVTSNAMVGGKNDDVLPVVDYLIGEARRQRKLPRPK
jgi:thiol:disulfide interchange protein DsbA